MPRIRRIDGPMAALLAAAVLALSTPGAAAAASGRYAVEFRARDGGVFGHTYVAYGPVERDGRLRRPHYAGFYPSGVLSDTPLLVFLATPARVGMETWDKTKRTEMVYRRELSAHGYAQLNREVGTLTKTRPFWHLVFYNCNSFAADVARWMGLQAPSTLQVPKDFVQRLYMLNRRGGVGIAYAAAAAGGRGVQSPDMLFLRVIGDEPVDR